MELPNNMAITIYIDANGNIQISDLPEELCEMVMELGKIETNNK